MMVSLNEEQHLISILDDEEVILLDEEQQLVSSVEDEMMVSLDKEQKFVSVLAEEDMVLLDDKQQLVSILAEEMVSSEEEQQLPCVAATEMMVSPEDEQHLVSVAEDEVIVSPDEEQRLDEFEVALMELEEFYGETTSRKGGDWHICHFFLWEGHVCLALMKAPSRVEASQSLGVGKIAKCPAPRWGDIATVKSLEVDPGGV